MMAAEYRKEIQRGFPGRKVPVDLRAAVDREHSPERKLKLLARYAYVGAVDADRLPCAFRTIGDEIEVAANRGVPYDPLVQADRRMVLGCGAALFRLRIAIQHVGYLPIVRTFPDPLEADRLAVIRLGPRREPAAAVEVMFERMQAAGRTSGGAPAGFPAPHEAESGQEERTSIDMDALRVDARREGTMIRAVRMQGGRTPVEIVDSARISTDEDILLVIATSRDLTPDHLNAGQALERILLGGIASGFQVDQDSDPIGDPGFRAELRDSLGIWPQVLLSRPS